MLAQMLMKSLYISAVVGKFIGISCNIVKQYNGLIIVTFKMWIKDKRNSHVHIELITTVQGPKCCTLGFEMLVEYIQSHC